ncbi:hypothetical protein KEJ47_10450 [Candidatus Bathyarchaeota archaeon]|nr:hypothetical protein [Candidatus Bathyarchaeota archaeon]
MIIPVKKITVVTLIDSERFILEEMGKLGVVQLRELRGDEFKGFRAESGEEEKTYDQLYERLKALHGKLSNGFYSTAVAAGTDIEPEKIEEIIRGYEERATELEVKLKDIDGRLDELKKAKPILDLMGEEEISPRSIGEFKHIFGKAGTIGPEDLHNLEIKLKPVKGLVYKIIPISGGEDFFFVSGLIELKPQVESILSTINHKEFKPPDGLVNASPDKVDDLVRSLENERDSLNKQMQELKQEFHTKYKAIESRIIELKNLSRARAKMLHSDTMAVLQGWTPEDRIPFLNSFFGEGQRPSQR